MFGAEWCSGKKKKKKKNKGKRTNPGPLPEDKPRRAVTARRKKPPREDRYASPPAPGGYQPQSVHHDLESSRASLPGTRHSQVPTRTSNTDPRDRRERDQELLPARCGMHRLLEGGLNGAERCPRRGRRNGKSGSGRLRRGRR